MEQTGASPSDRPQRRDSVPDANGRFLFKLFRRYYRSADIPMPERFTRREFGFIPFGGTMQRHMAFPTQDGLQHFLAAKVPQHSYYSTAYYRRPSEQVMDDKEWMGAELIFDLDADHLAGSGSMTYSEMMVQIRKEMVALVDDYLYGDLGFSEDQVHICFSGGRGYHAHVRSDDILTLGTHERREIVDYISCAGLDLDWVFPVRRNALGTKTLPGGAVRASVHEYRLIPSGEEGGWKRKMRNALFTAVRDLETDPKGFMRKYPGVKSTKPTLENLARKLDAVEEGMFARNTMADLKKNEQDILIAAVGDIAPTLSSEIDRPVTPDIKRLIRLPGSLHGKTGLRVSPLTRDQLTDYDPLQSAVPEVYTDDSVRVTVRKPMSLRMLGEDMTLEGETEVPEYAAAFLVGRKYADVGWARDREGRLFRGPPAELGTFI